MYLLNVCYIRQVRWQYAMSVLMCFCLLGVVLTGCKRQTTFRGLLSAKLVSNETGLTIDLFFQDVENCRTYRVSQNSGPMQDAPKRFIDVPSIVVGRVVKEGIEAKSITWADEATSKQLRTLASKCITSSGDNGSVK